MWGGGSCEAGGERQTLDKTLTNPNAHTYATPQAPLQRARARTANPAFDLGADEGDRVAEGYGLVHNAARDEAVGSGGGVGVGVGVCHD